tara:strand:+ start:10513 stop:10692 length:180 start_codon:yes stop_codon:yes gene_type:complete
MTNWDEVNRKKRKEITLGQSLNQALNFLLETNQGITEESYKLRAKAFFKWNTELQEELL